MITIGRKNAVAAREKAIADVAKLEQVISEHKIKRGQQLLEADDLATVANIDAAIEANQRAMVICRERIAALSDEADRQERERQEEARQSVITKTLTPRLVKIEKLAMETERTYLAFTANYCALQTAVKDFNSEFPPSIPRPRHSFYLNISDVERRLATALDRAARNGAKDGISAVTGISEAVQHNAARYIGELRATPLPDAPINDSEAA